MVLRVTWTFCAAITCVPICSGVIISTGAAVAVGVAAAAGHRFLRFWKDIVGQGIDGLTQRDAFSNEVFCFHLCSQERVVNDTSADTPDRVNVLQLSDT